MSRSNRASARIRVVIVDDEPVARKLLRTMLEDIDPERRIEVVEECANPHEAIAAIEDHAPDLVFLDVEMPGGNGFEVVESIGIDQMPTTVFVTAHDHYALRAFDVVAADYLLKPFDESRLRRALSRVMESDPEQKGPALDDLVAALPPELRRRPAHSRHVAVDVGTHMIFFATSRVDWVEAKGKHSLIHANDGTYLMREGLAAVEQRLDPTEFIRVHRSYIVRIDRIREIHRWFRGDYRLVLDDGTKLTTGSTFKRQIEAILLGKQRPST